MKRYQESWINRKIINYLCKLGFVFYWRHYIYGPADRLHWEKANNYFTVNAIFNTRSGHIFIGDKTVIGHNSCFLTGRHFFEKGKLKYPRNKQVPESGYDIRIGEGCWIASNVTILGGVDVGDDSIVCAGAVVTKKIEKKSVVAGIPAIVIGDTYTINNNAN
jgi:acetyltransferase-like isoleucine patch superfamily enzyme